MRNELINFRKKLGLTINEMAAKVGVSSSFYEKIEYGDRNPSFNFRLFVNIWGGIFLNPAPLLFLALIFQMVEKNKAIRVFGCT